MEDMWVTKAYMATIGYDDIVAYKNLPIVEPKKTQKPK